MLKQITVFLENKPGRLEEVIGYLISERITLHALTIADTTDFGILRMIVSDSEKVKGILKKKGLIVKTTDVIAIAVEHSLGGLHKILHELRELEISIEYMYAFTSRHEDYDSIVILRVDNQDISFDKLKKSNITILRPELLYSVE